MCNELPPGNKCAMNCQLGNKCATNCQLANKYSTNCQLVACSNSFHVYCGDLIVKVNALTIETRCSNLFLIYYDDLTTVYKFSR